MTLLYDNQIDIQFHPKLGRKKHVYTVDDEIIPNVTSILGVINKPALVPWAVNMCGIFLRDNIVPGQTYTWDEVQRESLIRSMKGHYRDTSGEALSIGTIVHQFAEDWALDKKPPPPINQKAHSAVMAFVDWWVAHKIKVVAVEKILYSREHGFCGTADLIAEVDGELSIVDYKTSKAIYQEYYYQVGGAYRVAFEEEIGLKVKRGIVARFDKENGGFEAKDCEDMEADWECFKSALTLYNRKENTK